MWHDVQIDHSPSKLYMDRLTNQPSKCFTFNDELFIEKKLFR